MYNLSDKKKGDKIRLLAKESRKKIFKKRREEWEELRSAISDKHAKRFNRILDEAEDKDFAFLYLNTLKYFKPSMASVPPKSSIQVATSENARNLIDIMNKQYIEIDGAGGEEEVEEAVVIDETVDDEPHQRTKTAKQLLREEAIQEVYKKRRETPVPIDKKKRLRG